MNRCEGLGWIALIALLAICLDLLRCLLWKHELKKTFCLDFEGRAVGFRGTLITIFFIMYLIYFTFWILPDCLWSYLNFLID